MQMEKSLYQQLILKTKKNVQQRSNETIEKHVKRLHKKS